VIEIVDLTKRYGTTLAVDRLSLTVATGELVVLLGTSGSGKTTTLKMVNRLIEPTAGRVLVDGTDTATMEPHLLRRRIGYVFQRVGLFPHLTVAENVAVPLTLLDWSQERIRSRVDELLALVELPIDTRGRAPSELSGGQQQRVGVARALAAEPTVMLLDEPFGSQSLIRIRRQLGLTGIFVTHDMVEALMMGDRIAVMHDGRLVQVGPPQALIQEPANDYVRQLMETPTRLARRVDALLAQGP
jgi:osmoprotectant transport system ATP-binding protein